MIDKLEADHRRVSELLDDVEQAAAGLTQSEDARECVTLALELLAESLLAHLDYEERNAGPTLRRL